MKNTTKNFTVKILVHSNWKKYGIDGNEIGLKFSGIVVTPNGIPTTVVKAIPIRIEPGTFITYKIIVITNPIIATSAEELLKSTKPIIVPKSDLAIPAFASPIKVINNPIPTATAFRKFAGIDLIIASLTPNNDNTINNKPSNKTAVRANCHEQPIPITTV